MTARNLTHDFTGLSTLLLGQAQPKQFQSASDPQSTGWWWDSKISDDGSFTPLSDFASNSNIEIPRSYNRGNNVYGVLYNWFSATAETGTYAMTNNRAADSICPKGWQLPVSAYNSSNSWSKLLIDAYELKTNGGDGSSGTLTIVESQKISARIPLSIAFSGRYNRTGDLSQVELSVDSSGEIWSSEASNNAKAYHFASWFGKSLYGSNQTSKGTGFSVRCVKK